MFGAKAFRHFKAGAIAKSCANHIGMTCPPGSACCRSSQECTACRAGFRSFLFCLHQRTGDEVELATVTIEKCHVYKEHNRFFEASISGQTLFARGAMAVLVLTGTVVRGNSSPLLSRTCCQHHPTPAYRVQVCASHLHLIRSVESSKSSLTSCLELPESRTELCDQSS